MEDIRVRFAPSPTGPLHIGGARSALFNYLWAKGRKGKLVLRIEDTDQERSSKESEENILDSLKWLGITWDEGPDVGGEYGPYRQMERLNTYAEYTEKLLKEGKAYYCYCTEEELEAERQASFAKGENPIYSGRCANLTEDEREAFQKEGRQPVIRFRVPLNQEIVIDDLVRGKVVFDSNGVGDFVIVKSDGIPTYNYAVVIDDALMKISHVVRAEEHLSNTPRQMLIYQALNFNIPKFAHISLILGKDRSKMSKRHGATSVVQYKENGFLPEAVVNFLALLGWSPSGEEELFDIKQLIEQFGFDRVAKNPAVFDMDKLRWINGMYIRKIPVVDLIPLALPYLQKGGYVTDKPTEEEMQWVEMVVTVLQEHLSSLNDITNHMDILVGEDVILENNEAKGILSEDTFPAVINLFKEKLLALDEIKPDTVKPILKAITKELKLGGKKVFMPIRIAITGRMHGPDLPYIISILGRDLTLLRIKNTLQQAGLNI